MTEIIKELDAFLNRMKMETPDAFFEQDKETDLFYMNNQEYRYIETLRRLPNSREPIKILDIGTSPFTFFIKETYPQYKVTTIDLNARLQTRCEAKGVEFKKCDLGKDSIPFDDNSFDIVIFSEVLEHIFAPPLKVLEEVRRVIKKEGVLILSVPNIATLIARIRFLGGVNPLVYFESLYTFHLYTMKECVSLLTKCNFTIMRKSFISPGPVHSLIHGTKPRKFSLVRSTYDTLCFLLPPFRDTLYIECQKP
jgi:ubiquinone/menaquinone biosynthesis C-methylase UbiE